MSSLTHLIRALSGPLAVEPRFLQTFVGVMRRKLAGEQFSGLRLHAELGMEAAAAGGKKATAPARIAVIPIEGAIALHANSLGTSTEEIAAATAAAVKSRNVDGILYLVDSPGGTVTGVPETADQILAAGKVKPTLAYVPGMMASAGYWLGSAANEVWMAKSADGAGAIGVFALHEDWSKNLEQEGVAISAISAGKFKLEGVPWAPLADEARDFLQASVDEAYDWFVKAVSIHRKDSQANVRAGYGEGRVLGAADALKANLIDRIGTLDEAVARLSSRITSKTRSAVAVERERLAMGLG